MRASVCTCNAHIGSDKHPEHHSIIISFTGVGNLVEPENIIFGKKLRPLQATYSHLKAKAITAWFCRVGFKCDPRWIVIDEIKPLVVIIIHQKITFLVCADTLAEITVPGIFPTRIIDITELIGPERRPRIAVGAHGNFLLIGVEVPAHRFKCPRFSRPWVFIPKFGWSFHGDCNDRMK